MKNTLIKLCLTICVILPVCNVQAQSNVVEAKFKNGSIELNKFIAKKFAQEAKKHDLNVCLISAVFAKFSVDSAGNIKNITFSGNKVTPQIFKTLLSTTILATNGMWIPKRINGKPVNSNPFIVPLIYAMEGNCNPKDVQSNSTYIPVNNSMENALNAILDFENGTEDKPVQLQCTLLKPLYVFSQN